MKITDGLVLRNRGFIDEAVQARLASLRLLIAGCGVGSVSAEAAVRLGVQKFTLVDGDKVELHNLNRQSFCHSDIGRPKVEALKSRLIAINPEAEVRTVDALVSAANSRALILECDIVLDTIDFLDLGAIVRLHDSALELRKPVISVFTAGWGAVAIFVPGEPRERSWIRDIFGLGDGDASKESYTERFLEFFGRFGAQLNPEVQRVMGEVLLKMRDRSPCPAPHVVAGAQCSSALALKLLTGHLTGQPIPQAPDFVYLDLERVLQEGKISPQPGSHSTQER